MIFFKNKKNQKIKQLEKELRETKSRLGGLSSYLNELLIFLPLAICDIDDSGAIVSVNKAFEEISGCKTGTTKAKLSDFFVEKTALEKLLHSAGRQGEAKDRELTLITRERRKIPVAVNVLVKEKSQKKNSGDYFVSISDLSAFKKVQKKTEKEVKERTKELLESRRALLNILEDTEEAKQRAEEEKNKTQVIFENFIDGLLMFNEKGRLEMINPRAEGFLNVEKEEVLEKTIEELKKNEKTKELMRVLAKSKKGEVFKKELPLPKKEIVLEITTKKIVFGQRPMVMLAILHDITREKMIEKLKSQFVSVAAHQLRTPLSIIKWSLSMVLEGEMGKMPEEQRETLARASETNERMIRLINDLLNVARIEEGRFIYQPTTVDIIELLEKTTEPAQQLAANKKVKFELKRKLEGSAIVKVDIEKISLAIKNLTENAVSYTKLGGKVTLKVEKKKEKLLISVKDTGIGIPKKQQERVFSKFFRGENAVRTETEGTGLGLFIAKNVIEAHGGELWFESQEGKGTTFYFTLPFIG